MVFFGISLRVSIILNNSFTYSLEYSAFKPEEICSGKVYHLLVEQLKCVVAEGRQEVEDYRNIFVDKVRKALVFLGPGPSLCHFWWCSCVEKFLALLLQPFLGFVEHYTVEIFRHSLVPKLY